MQRKKSQRSSNSGTGRTFNSNYVIPGQSFVAVLRNNLQWKPQIQQPKQVHQTPGVTTKVPSTTQQHTHTGQYAQASSESSSSLGSMFEVAIVVQNIMTEFNEAVSEDAKIVAITKAALNLTKQNCH
jgi:ABC-type phosphate transport system substrate-binding protein